MKEKRKWFLSLCLMLVTTMAWAQSGTVTGQVTDQNDEPLIGVTILVDGQTTGGTVTDFDGNYSIKAPSNATLKFSYIGYQDQKIAVGGKSVINVKMSEDAALLEEVVVVGYGTVKKESLTGAVTTIDAKAFQEKGSMDSPLAALQGQVAGVIITRSSSAPGESGWDLNLRGSVSANGTKPLVIIDGVAASVDEMGNLNPNDIESINFLKDGSAAIYGSRAAGGVVLVQTKKGKEGKVRVDYGGSATVKLIGLQPELMNLDQWSRGVMQTLENDRETSSLFYAYAQLAQKYKGMYIDPLTTAKPFSEDQFAGVSDFPFADTNWLDNLFGSAWSTEHNLSISGGTDKSSYRISLGYNYEGSNLKYGDNNNQRFTLRFNNQYKLTDKLKLESVIGYTRQERVSPTQIESVLTDTYPMPGLPFSTIDGNYYGWSSETRDASPVGKLEQGGNKNFSLSRTTINETLNYEILDWLTANASVGYTTTSKWTETVANPVTFYNYAATAVEVTWPTQEDTYYRTKSERNDFFQVSAYVNGKKTFGDHNLSLTLGTQYEYTKYKNLYVEAKNIQTGLEVQNGTTDIKTPISSSGNNNYAYKYAIMSYFGRFNYDYKGRYLLEAQARYDGSSKFLPENRWDFFWGVSAGWRINEEKFLRDVKWINNLKLRASYAEVGNQEGIGYYDGVQLYSAQSLAGAYVGSNKLSYIAPNGTLASTSRSWERIKNYNVAIDFGFPILGGQLNGTFEYFLKKNDNMLVNIDFPSTLGLNAPKANSGKFKDWGWEGQVTFNGKIGKVDYHIGGTFTFARNELEYLGATAVSATGYRSNAEGYPLNALFGLRYGGKIENEEMLQAYLNKYYENNGIGMPSNLRVGDNMYCDENGDGVLDAKDYIFLGSRDPEISYSFNFGASWKGLDVNVVFQGAANRFVWRGINNFTVPFRAIYTNTTTASVGEVWSTENPSGRYNPYTHDANIINYNYQPNSQTAQDGRYLRLKNVSIGYTLPKALMQKTHVLQNARIYVTGTDLWETSKINDGWDPENVAGGKGINMYPFTRNLTFGMNLTF